MIRATMSNHAVRDNRAYNRTDPDLVREDRYKRYAQNFASFLEEKNGKLEIKNQTEPDGPSWNRGQPLPFQDRLRLEAEQRQGIKYIERHGIIT